MAQARGGGKRVTVEPFLGGHGLEVVVGGR